MSFRVATYNILANDYLLGGLANKDYIKDLPEMRPNWNDWNSRKDAILNNIKAISADIICLQEVGKKESDELSKGFPKLGYNSCFIEHSGGKKDGIAILYSSRFKKSSWTQEGIGSYFSGKQEWVHGFKDFEDTITKRIVRIYNCHLVGGGKDTKNEHIKAVLKTEPSFPQFANSEYRPAGEFIVGDFNEENGPRVKFLKDNNFTGNNAEACELGTNRKLDWIFHKECSSWRKTKIIAKNVPFRSYAIPEEDKWVSDHLPMARDFLIMDSELPKGSFRELVYKHFVQNWQIIGDFDPKEYLEEALEEANYNVAKSPADFEQRTTDIFSKLLGNNKSKKSAMDTLKVAFAAASAESNAKKKKANKPAGNQAAMAGQVALTAVPTVNLNLPVATNNAGKNPANVTNSNPVNVVNSNPANVNSNPTNVVNSNPVNVVKSNAVKIPSPSIPQNVQQTSFKPGQKSAGISATSKKEKSFFERFGEFFTISIPNFFKAIGRFFKEVFVS